ncbi:MAG: hypothetical protein LBU80_05520 [Rikenellaceae bacterium]|jgi:hypothetical protein|nr:hypothetical protein [Rikenellaceae bacterium]
MARFKTVEITKDNFFDFTPKQLFTEIERLRTGCNVDELKTQLNKAQATINRVNNALKPPKPRGIRAKKS